MKKFRKISSALLAAGILTTSLPVYSAAAAVGDLNGDGAIDKADVKTFAQYFAGWTIDEDAKEGILAAGDVNGDDEVTRADAMELARSVEGWETINEKRNQELADIAERNDGELPEIYLEEEDNIPQFIMGKYSDTVVTDYDSAIESLNDVQNLMLMESPEDNFVGMNTSERNGTSFYKLQQTYKGLRVYGKQVIVSTDEDGNIKSMSGDYDPLFEIDTTPVVSEEEARVIASEECGYENTAEAELVIYSMDGQDMLVWLFNDMCYDIVIDATNGSILKNSTNIHSASYGGLEFDNTTWVFPVDYNNGLYSMRDSKRNINIHTAAKYTYDELGSIYPHWSNYLIVDEDNDWKKEYGIAAALFCRIIETYDYFENVLGLKSFDNLGSPIQGFINLSPGFLEGINAYGGGARGEFAVILLTHHWDSSPSLQTIGHEFTHAVEKAHSNLLVGKETSAIMEAYSDIMGELVEEYYSGTCDWIDTTGLGRNIKNPLAQTDKWNKSPYPVHYHGTGYYTGTEEDYGSHHNSTVISHAIYKLHSSKVIDSDTLAKLLLHTLEYINQTCDFSEYRLAVYCAAKNLGLSNNVLSQIDSVFNAAQITNSQLKLVSGHIINEANDAIAGATVTLFNETSTETAVFTSDDRGYIEGFIDSDQIFTKARITADGYEVKTIDVNYEVNNNYSLGERKLSKSKTIASGICGDNATWTLTSDGTLTISGTGAMYDFSQGGAPWKSYNDSIQSVIIEEGITTVGCWAFENCALTTVQLPSTMRNIRYAGFIWCPNLESLIVPEGVDDIGDYAIHDCDGLKYISLPSTLPEFRIFEICFCDGIESITVHADNPVLSSMNGSVYNKDKTTLIYYPQSKADTHFTIPSSVTSISSSAIEGKKYLKTVTVPESVTEIGEKNFYDCRELTNVTFLGMNTSIGNSCVTNSNNATISAYSSSDAETYAYTNGITFILLEK